MMATAMAATTSSNNHIMRHKSPNKLNYHCVIKKSFQPKAHGGKEVLQQHTKNKMKIKVKRYNYVAIWRPQA